MRWRIWPKFFLNVVACRHILYPNFHARMTFRLWPEVTRSWKSCIFSGTFLYIFGVFFSFPYTAWPIHGQFWTCSNVTILIYIPFRSFDNILVQKLHIAKSPGSEMDRSQEILPKTLNIHVSSIKTYKMDPIPKSPDVIPKNRSYYVIKVHLGPGLADFTHPQSLCKVQSLHVFLPKIE